MSDKSSAKAGYLEQKHRFFHLRDTAGQERDYHYHDFDKIVVLLSGRVDYAVEDKIYAIRPGDVLLVRRHTIHKAIIDISEPYDRVIIYLNSSFYANLLPDTDLGACFDRADKLPRHLLSPEEAEADRLFDIMSRYEESSARGNSPLERAERETLILHLLILLNSIGSDEQLLPALKDPKIEDTLSYINDNLGEKLSVELLAERIFLSRYHFMRLFKAATGSTVHAYIRQKRLLNASRLIREGMGAADAAAMSGFGDYSAFHRAYKSSFGISPGALKRRSAEGQEKN